MNSKKERCKKKEFTYLLTSGNNLYQGNEFQSNREKKMSESEKILVDLRNHLIATRDEVLIPDAENRNDTRYDDGRIGGYCDVIDLIEDVLSGYHRFCELPGYKKNGTLEKA